MDPPDLSHRHARPAPGEGGAHAVAVAPAAPAQLRRRRGGRSGSPRALHVVDHGRLDHRPITTRCNADAAATERCPAAGSGDRCSVHGYETSGVHGALQVDTAAARYAGRINLLVAPA